MIPYFELFAGVVFIALSLRAIYAQLRHRDDTRFVVAETAVAALIVVNALAGKDWKSAGIWTCCGVMALISLHFSRRRAAVDSRH